MCPLERSAGKFLEEVPWNSHLQGVALRASSFGGGPHGRFPGRFAWAVPLGVS